MQPAYPLASAEMSLRAAVIPSKGCARKSQFKCTVHSAQTVFISFYYLKYSDEYKSNI